MEREIENVEKTTILASVNETGLVSPEISQRILDLGLLIYRYYTPLLFVCGIIGNSLSILVFICDLKYRKKSSSYYLIALAISDSGFLTNLFVVWLGHLNNGVITSSFVCPLVMYLGQVTCFVSVYLTVAFSIERYIAIYFPFKKLRFCTASNARKVIWIIVTTALVIFSYVWVIAEVAQVEIYKVRSSVCTVSIQYHKLSERANYLDSIFTLVIPFFVITYFNVRIAIKLCKKETCGSINAVSIRFDDLTESKHNRKITLPKIKKRRRDVIQVAYIPIAYIDCFKFTPNYDGNKYRNSCLHRHTSRVSETSVTKTLLLVSVIFLCLNIPLHVVRAAQFIQLNNQGYRNGLKLTLAFQPWAMILFNTNFAVNFFLYCLSGQDFRNSLRNIIARFIYMLFC